MTESEYARVSTLQRVRCAIACLREAHNQDARIVEAMKILYAIEEELFGAIEVVEDKEP